MEILSREKWNVPELSDRMDVIEQVVSDHSEQIAVIKEKLA